MNTRIKELRKILKYTQQDYARELGISQSHLSGIENGKETASPTLIKLIGLKFLVNEDWLLKGEGEVFIIEHAADIYLHEESRNQFHAGKNLLDKFMQMHHDEDRRRLIESYNYFVDIISFGSKGNKLNSGYIKSIHEILRGFSKLIQEGRE